MCFQICSNPLAVFAYTLRALSTTSRISKLKGPAKLQSYAGTRQGSCFSEYESAVIEMCNFCKWKSFKINHRHWLHMKYIWWEYDDMITWWHCDMEFCNVLARFDTCWHVFRWQIVTTGGPVIAPYTPAPGGPCAQTSSFCAGRKFGRTRMNQEMDQDGKNCVLKLISVIGEFWVWTSWKDSLSYDDGQQLLRRELVARRLEKSFKACEPIELRCGFFSFHLNLFCTVPTHNWFAVNKWSSTVINQNQPIKSKEKPQF